MKNILGIIGSPRKAGNSELLVKEICRNVTEEHILRLIRLPRLQIKPCRACYKCITEDQCPIHDDFKLVMDNLKETDAIIIAAPCYLLGPNASIKLFLDRGLQFYTCLDQIWGKPAITVTVAGVEGQEGYTSAGLAILARFMGLDVKENAVFFGALPGEVLLDEKNKKRAAHLGRILFDNGYRKEQKDYLCPVCFSDIFQFLPGKRIKCMVCRHEGKISPVNGSFRIDIKPGQSSFFMTYKEAKEHKEWLKGMKERFLEKRTELKEVASNYTKDGIWIDRVEK
nr:flavodoxin family protein [Desulfobacterales bacterium]